MNMHPPQKQKPRKLIVMHRSTSRDWSRNTFGSASRLLDPLQKNVASLSTDVKSGAFSLKASLSWETYLWLTLKAVLVGKIYVFRQHSLTPSDAALTSCPLVTTCVVLTCRTGPGWEKVCPLCARYSLCMPALCVQYLVNRVQTWPRVVTIDLCLSLSLSIYLPLVFFSLALFVQLFPSLSLSLPFSPSLSCSTSLSLSIIFSFFLSLGFVCVWVCDNLFCDYVFSIILWF